MALAAEDRERLADIVELQPTKNAELQDRWGLDSGSEVHQYLESALADYYYRDDNSLIRATDEAAELVDVKPGVEENGGGNMVVRVPELDGKIIDILPGPDERSISVVATLDRVSTTEAVSVDDVRAALQRLKRKGVVETVYRIVPTYRLDRPRDSIVVEAGQTESN